MFQRSAAPDRVATVATPGHLSGAPEDSFGSALSLLESLAAMLEIEVSGAAVEVLCSFSPCGNSHGHDDGARGVLEGTDSLGILGDGDGVIGEQGWLELVEGQA
jgi:hypothetical protein